MKKKDMIAEKRTAEDFELIHEASDDKDVWRIRIRQTDEYIAAICTNQIEDAVVEIEWIEMRDEQNGVEMALECVLNHLYYRMNVRKAVMNSLSNDTFKKALIDYFGFHLDAVKEINLENDETIRIESYSLYKEEYIGWLRKRGKLLGFLKAGELKLAFLLAAFTGIVLLGIDLLNENSTLQTLLYAYLTGLGTAGAIACSWLDFKRKGDEHRAG